jgi:CheY-like chemotaxis protein
MMARILLVDDDSNLVESARDILEDAGYEVESANTVRSALQVLEGHVPYQLMISDLNLPDGTGLDLAGKVRDLFPTMKILLMTGQAEDSQPAGLAARQEGLVDHYLVKPVSPPQLLQLLERML